MMKWLKLGIGIVLLFVPLWFVDWRETLSVMANADLRYLGAAVLLLSVNMPLSSLKWELLLHLQEVRAGFVPVLKAYWIGSFFSNYLPSNVGGDVVRLFVLKCEGKRAEVASSILVERITGLLVLLALGAIGLAMRPQYFDFTGGLFFLWSLILGVSAILAAALLWNEGVTKLLRMLPVGQTRLVNKVIDILARITSSMTVYRQQPGSLVTALALSLPFYLILMVFQYLILVGVGASVSLIEVMYVAPMIPLVSMIPISANGLGLAEGAFIVFYTQLGVAPEAALAAALLARVLSLIVSLAGGVFWISSPARERAA